jgi:hypothetical protein
MSFCILHWMGCESVCRVGSDDVSESLSRPVDLHVTKSKVPSCSLSLGRKFFIYVCFHLSLRRCMTTA